MRRSHALLLLLIVLVTFALWWLAGGGDSAPRDSSSVSDPVSVAATAAPPAVEVSAAAGDLARADAPVPAAAAEATAPLGRNLTVRVVFAEDGKPAAGAEVLLTVDGSLHGLSSTDKLAHRDANFDEQLDRWGTAFACDAGGVAKIPMPESGWFPVAARLNEHWARRDVRPEERDVISEITLSLRPAIHVQVLVVDEARQPVAGVPVAYRALRRGRGHSQEEMITDADGLAQLRHLQDSHSRNLGHADRNVVAIGLPFEPTVQAEFDPLNPPSEPILLVLPGTGSVEVEVLDLAGQPAKGFNVALQKKMSEEDRKAYGESKGMIHQDWLGLRWMPIQDGMARFDQVGLGLTVEFGADFERTSVMETGTGPGPQRPGEVVRYTLRQAAAAPVLTGRIVDDAGLPIAGADLDAWVHPADGGRRLARVRIISDASGRFRTNLGLDPADAAPKFLLTQQEQPGFVRMLRAPLPAPLAPGENEIGDLVLGGPVFVAGQVLTPEGQPAATAYGSMDQAEERGFGAASARSAFESISWQAGPDGRFEIRGDYPPGSYRARVWVHAEQTWRCEPVAFESGTKDVLLQLLSSAGVRGRILTNAMSDLADLQLLLLQNGSGGGGGPDPADGSFYLRADAPGTYDLEVRSGGMRNLLWARKNLPVAAGSTTEVGDLDLRGLLRTTISVLDPEGRPVLQGRLCLIDLAGRWGAQLQETTLPITLLHAEQQATAFLEVPGHARAEVPLRGGEQIVRLVPGYRVRISLTGLPAPAKGGGWGLTLMHKASEGQVPSARIDEALAPGASSAEAILATAGTWLVVLTHQSHSQGDRRWVTSGLSVPEALIEVRADSGLQEFEFTVDPAAAAAAIQRP